MTTQNPGLIKETTLLLGDCLDKLKELDDNSIDSIVSDPPYGLAFMGKKWDYDVPSQEIWKECIRVLKPGGHLLSFAGSRTYHRMAVRIEDAGFEIRDQIMWIYGSGFPKSHNIGKSIDKKEGNEREVVGIKKNQGDIRGKNGLSGEIQASRPYIDTEITKGNSEWEGWGTALKPAHEPIVMARKPLVGTVANNVLEWGVGGINIDGCRIETDWKAERPESWFNSGKSISGEPTYGGNLKTLTETTLGERLNEGGRFPANIILDEEAGRILDEQSGLSKSTNAIRKNNQAQHTGAENGATCYGKYNSVDTAGYDDKGGASRFFYCPKANKTDRNEGCDSLEDKGYSINQAHNSKTLEERYALKSKNNHPTVKPTDLMQYLIRLVTPKGGIVLDPFMGSGSTGKAAIKEGMIFVGIEREDEYYQIAKQRIEWEVSKKPNNKFW
jgi:site-specific DNA-methyltransferase (adenine-specific)